MICHLLINPLYPALIQAFVSMLTREPHNQQAKWLKALAMDYGVERAASLAVKKYGIVKSIEMLEE